MKNLPSDLIEEIGKQVKAGLADESISIRFEDPSRQEVLRQETTKEGRRTTRQLRVTDLVNPMQWFYDVKGPVIADPPELRRRFDYGKAMERKVTEILSNEPGFIHLAEQGKLNGAICRMNEVNGKIDFRIGNSIIEFKTAEDAITDEEDLFKNHPQNLEQLLLYILFSGRERYEHKLLYVTGKYPNLVPVAFKVKVTDKGKLVNYFAVRLVRMKSVAEKNVPAGLGKCRCHNYFCKFKESKTCSCSRETEIAIG
ncbi:MAG: hypothetical protein M1386_03295 [Candidatus Thermoplasmatota archaeon]|nr:hypothetical protein [Candidatus Thermoplasmatota archaeon]